MRLSSLLGVAVLLAGCAHAGERPGSSFVGAPKRDRCAAQSTRALRESCNAARAEATDYVHKLFTDDQICLDGDHELRDTSRECRVRAFVQGSAPNSLELEIRHVSGTSRYQEGQDWWFHEAALVDLSLQASGYAAPSDAAPGAGRR